MLTRPGSIVPCDSASVLPGLICAPIARDCPSTSEAPLRPSALLPRRVHLLLAFCAFALFGGLVGAQPVHVHGEGGSHTHAVSHDHGYHMALRGSYSAEQPRWWKGNTHTHTWWSDGDSPPEIASAWYREHGYQFLVLSDHNIMQKGHLARGAQVQSPTFWYALERPEHHASLAAYRRHFGDDWVRTRERDGKTEVRLRTLDEFRHLFEASGEFIFVQGEEITARHENHPVHINGINLQEVIQPRDGASVAEVLQNNLNAVFDHGVASGREVIAHVNHPNFRYAITVEDMLALRFGEGEGFFELYNGHHGVENYGDEWRVGLERMWDIVLATRLSAGQAPLYAVANDDAHSFAAWKIEQHSNPGRGWVMVRSTRLTPDFIVAAMKRGDFYNSTGVVLSELSREGNTLSLEIAAEAGVDYTVDFVGTRKGVDLQGRPIDKVPEEIQGRVSLQYSDDIGVVFASVKGSSAEYRLRGDELYVRARVTSSKPHPHGYKANDREMAWTQPLVAPVQ